MKIIEAAESDIPQIINLLKISLGESLMPKTEEYWRWKHIQNPFGNSPVIIAKEGESIIGVRAFMKWEWIYNGEIIRALRAVDTATHPNYQGKGIFKKLTLELIERSSNEGFDIIYNTPNKFSKPGYLKMGWQEVGKLPIQLIIKRPVNVLKSFINRNNTQFIKYPSLNLSIPKELNYNKKGIISTNYSNNYLNWRYKTIPGISYYSEKSENAIVIFRLKKTFYGIELRIVDFFGDPPQIGDCIKNIYQMVKFDYLSMSGFSQIHHKFLFKLKRKIGPDITIRQLNRWPKEFKNFEKWNPSLGDMEVF